MAIQVTLDQVEESLAEVIIRKVLVLDLEEEDPMAMAVTIDPVAGHVTLSAMAVVVVTIKVKVKAHLKATEAEQCPQED